VHPSPVSVTAAGYPRDADFIRRRSDGYLAVSGVQFLEAPSSDISRQEVQLPHRVLDHLIHIVAVGFVQDVSSIQAGLLCCASVLEPERSHCTAGRGKVSTLDCVPFPYDFAYCADVAASSIRAATSFGLET
jgi:hypothetical protein